MKYINLLFAAVLTVLVLHACTKDSGEVEVTYLEATAIYGSMDDLRAVALNEEARPIDNPGKIYLADDFVLIGEEGKGIHVLNNSDRNHPVAESFMHIPGNKEFFVSEQYLYAESYYDLVKIDISNPAQAKLVGRAEFAIQDEFINDKGETLIGFDYEEKTITLDENDDFMNEILGDQLVYLDFAKNVIPKSSVPSSFAGNSAQAIGTVNRITRSNGFVYVVSNNNMIVVEDLENGFSNNVRRLVGVKDDMETVFPYQNKLFVGSKTSMSIFDVSTGDQPNELYEFDHATSCDPVLPYGDVAYITLRTADFSACPGNINALLSVDVSDLSKPQQLEEIQLASPYGMAVINGYLFVGNGENGLSIFDISTPGSPQLVASKNDVVAYDIISDPSDQAYIFLAGNDGMKQYQLQDDLSLQWTSNIDY